ncbi:MAG TPA: ABC transporter ATP-binding protein [Bacillota bacterium]|nr:ABC transporter ATP-binding protein [Bacillota bacterium]
MALISLQQACKCYNQQGAGSSLSVLEDLNLEITEGEVVTIIGPSGCGKSTLFRILAGLEQLDHGNLLVENNQDLRGMVSYMPQKDMLMPWRSVLDNAILGLELAGVSRAKARETAREMLPYFGLEEFAQALPRELSGGMRQRVALLRTMLPGRTLLLLDEPFGALDAITRFKMQAWLLDLWQQFKPTILFVTHDIEEAIFLSDRIYVFSSRPAKVKLEVPVRLDRPRNSNTFAEPEFIRLRQEILKALE